MAEFDVIFAGGGLSTGLSALKLKKAKPQLRMAIVEQGPRLGGNHTWSFHGSDVGTEDLRDLQPMVRSSWPAQDVRFPDLRRTLRTSYSTIVSDDFHEHISERFGEGVLLNQKVSDVSSSGVTLAGGEVLSAPCVIDGRGPRREISNRLALAWQKFFGLEVELQEPHGLKRPTIMDATVAQTDGYRFFYCLPFTETSLLIEDTYYSTSMQLDQANAAEHVFAYARERGWKIARIEREEIGCLPIVLAGKSDAFDAGPEDAVPCGLRAGLFHAGTGYSLPDAVRAANAIAGIDRLTTDAARETIAKLRTQVWEQGKFYRLLNRLLFIAAQGEEKREIMQRFYRFPEPLIERFYAGRSTALDKFKVLSGKPPIPLGNAALAVPAQSAWQFVSDGATARGR